jgi:hypothetical protein
MDLLVQLYRRNTLSSVSRYLCQHRPTERRMSRPSLRQLLPSRWFLSCMETSLRIGLWTELTRSSNGGTLITFETAVILSGLCQYTTDWDGLLNHHALQVRSCCKGRYLCFGLLSLQDSNFIHLLYGGTTAFCEPTQTHSCFVKPSEWTDLVIPRCAAWQPDVGRHTQARRKRKVHRTQSFSLNTPSSH